jgi:prepilin-type N-terminal cleavage/methylation domain-containing protein
MKKFEQRRKAQRGGFTLIEMTVVIMVLAIVAGLAVPLVGWLRRSANYASQANAQAAVASNLEFYRTTYGNNNYPNHMDSLLVTSTEAEISYVDSGLGRLIVAGSIDGDYKSCLSKWCTHVLDHDATAFAGLQGNPGNSAFYDRDLDYSAAFNLAVLDIGTDGQTPTSEATLLLNELYGDADEWLVDNGATSPTTGDVVHVILGIGPRNDAVGTTMQAAPTDSRVDGSEVYGRFCAVFATYSPRAGKRAQLKAIVNAKGRTANNALSEFWQSTNPE